MKTNIYFYSQPNYLFRTAIEAEILLNNFIDFLKGEDTNKLAFAAISFGLAFFLNPVEANFTDGLFNHLSSKAEGQVPTTSGIDKDTLDLLSQIIEEYER